MVRTSGLHQSKTDYSIVDGHITTLDLLARAKSGGHICTVCTISASKATLYPNSQRTVFEVVHQDPLVVASC